MPEPSLAGSKGFRLAPLAAEEWGCARHLALHLNLGGTASLSSQ